MEFSTLVDLLHYRSHHQPHDLAYIFLKNGETELPPLTYQELDQKAKAIALELNALIPPGSRALMVYPYEAGLEFITAFFGCLYAGVVAVPIHPPRNRRNFYDVRSCIESCQAQMALTVQSQLSNFKNQLGSNSDLIWLATNTLSTATTSQLTQPKINPDTLAFLQYTSGSTGKPKGVMIAHDCILNNQKILKLAFRHGEDAIGVSWLPLFHDMGLIGTVFQALYLGRPCILMSPIAFIQKPIRWLQAISRYRATTSGGPNFAYDLLCNQVTKEQKRKLDLSSWDVAFNGAETVRPQTLERFAKTFSECGFCYESFYPCYGMAEATLFITGGEKDKPPTVRHIDQATLRDNRVIFTDVCPGSQSIVSCGQPRLNTTVKIVDPHSLTECPEGRVGEIWIDGPGVAKGYWNLPEQTRQTFQAALADTGQFPFLRTRDLGFIHRGELFVTGRLQEVLVFWGINHYPQNLEETIQDCHPALKVNGGAAFSVELDGENRLVIAHEVDRDYRHNLDVDAVVQAVRWRVFEQHMVDVYGLVFVKPGALPRTSSGKIRRLACREMFLRGDLDSIAEWRSPQTEAKDLTALLQKYFNPATHLKRYFSLIKGRTRQLFLGQRKP
ncbi:MAG: fatty acyl-AMP ligase [Limnospira sp.]